MDERKRIIFELIEATQAFRDARLKGGKIFWHGLSESTFAALLITILESEELSVGALLTQYQDNNEAFLAWALAQLKKIQSEELAVPNLPPNLEELREQLEEAKREQQTFLEKQGKGLSPKEQIEIWIKKQKEIYLQRQLEKAAKVTAEKIEVRRTHQVVIPQKLKGTEKEKEQREKTANAVEKLQKWIDSNFLKYSFLQQNIKLRQGMTTTVQRILSAYLPELSEKEAKKFSPEKREKVAEACQNAIVDALALPVADQVAAEGTEIKPAQIRQIIEDFTPSPQFPQTFSPFLPLLTLSKKERFSEERYRGAKEVSLEKTENGLSTLLFIPERVQAAILGITTFPLRSALTENPESTFSLIDPQTREPIRTKIHHWLTTHGIDPTSYQTLRLFTAEIRSLRLLCLGVTPKILIQTIEKQKGKGIKETDPLIKILRIIHQDLVDFENKIGFPVKLVKAWARVKASISQPHQPIEVGTRQVYPSHQPEKLKTGRRAELRERFLNWAIKNKIYQLKAGSGETVQVENRLFQPISLPAKFIYQRAFQPVLTRLGKTALGRTVKTVWRKAKNTALNTAWTVSKQGFKKFAKEGLKKAGSWLATKLGLTAIASIIGTPIGGAITFVATAVLPWLAKKAKQILTWPFRFLRNLFSGKDKRGQRIIEGFGGFMDQLTSGETFLDSKALKFIFIIVFIVLFFLGFFISDIEPSSAWITSKVPTETRFVGPIENLPGRRNMTSADLKEIFEDAAEKYCIPLPMLLAISQIEASGVWSYIDTEVAKFSTPDWWEETGCKMDEKVAGDCTRGYCYDTCKVTNLCPSYSVVGPMQFEQGTWNSYLASLRADFEEEGNPHEPHRCNLQDSIWAAAMKIKANSSTANDQCTAWDEETVRKTARAHCGSCGVKEECGDNPSPECQEQHKACGESYCAAVVMLYNEYK